MPYRKVGTLEACWYILKQKIRDLLFGCDREDPCKPVYTKLPDGTIQVTWRPKEGRKKK